MTKYIRCKRHKNSTPKPSTIRTIIQDLRSIFRIYGKHMRHVKTMHNIKKKKHNLQGKNIPNDRLLVTKDLRYLKT